MVKCSKNLVFKNIKIKKNNIFYHMLHTFKYHVVRTTYFEYLVSKTVKLIYLPFTYHLSTISQNFTKGYPKTLPSSIDYSTELKQNY